jgi:deazaflavin-dependent oxidoreductase (nitroreductase family)
MMSNQNERHQQLIEEFRAHGGKVGGRFEGAPLLLLTTTGARSGKRRTTPLRYLSDGNRQIVFAANAGADNHPAWYYNLLAHPDVTIEIGTETFTARAIVLKDEERARLLAAQIKVYPHFNEYRTKTTRQIPVIALVRQPVPGHNTNFS